MYLTEQGKTLNKQLLPLVTTQKKIKKRLFNILPKLSLKNLAGMARAIFALLFLMIISQLSISGQTITYNFNTHSFKEGIRHSPKANETYTFKITNINRALYDINFNIDGKTVSSTKINKEIISAISGFVNFSLLNIPFELDDKEKESNEAAPKAIWLPSRGPNAQIELIKIKADSVIRTDSTSYHKIYSQVDKINKSLEQTKLKIQTFLPHKNKSISTSEITLIFDDRVTFRSEIDVLKASLYPLLAQEMSRLSKNFIDKKIHLIKEQIASLESLKRNYDQLYEQLLYFTSVDNQFISDPFDIVDSQVTISVQIKKNELGRKYRPLDQDVDVKRTYLSRGYWKTAISLGMFGSTLSSETGILALNDSQEFQELDISNPTEFGITANVHLVNMFKPYWGIGGFTGFGISSNNFTKFQFFIGPSLVFGNNNSIFLNAGLSIGTTAQFSETQKNKEYELEVEKIIPEGEGKLNLGAMVSISYYLNF